jgi:hypothetical protein
MGERFAPLDPSWNRDGSFEDLDVGNLINTLATAFRVRSGYLENPDPEKIRELQALIAGRSAKYSLWGLKCFGLLYLMPEFARHCPEPPRLLVMRRPFASSVNSFLMRSGYDLGRIVQQFGHDLYNLDMVYKTYPGPKTEIRFDDLVDNPAEGVRAIASLCEIPVGDMAALIDPSQRRF